MTVRPPSPMTASRTRMTVSSGWNSREVSLNGRLIGVTGLDPAEGLEAAHQARLAGADLADHGDDDPLDADVVVRLSPSARIRLLTALVSAAVAVALITTNIGARASFRVGRVLLLSASRPTKKAEV